MARIEKLRIDFPERWLAGLTGVAVVLRLTLRVPLSATFFAVLVVLPLAGILVTIDDDLPGGWSNPDGTVRPVWLESAFWRKSPPYSRS